MQHIVRAGSGRAGSALLVRLFDELGLDTGAGGLEYSEDAHAGLETPLTDPEASRVVKDPTIDFGALFDSGSADPSQIERVVLPVRTLCDAATSRLRRSAVAIDIDADGGVTGTVWRPWIQRWILAVRVHRVVVAAGEHDLPLTVVHYPRFAHDPAYARRRLAGVAGDVSREQFERTWHRAVNPELVRTDLPPLSAAERVRLGLAVLHTSIRRCAVRVVHWVRRHRRVTTRRGA